MEKIEGYEECEALTGEFEVLEPGGYICEIISAKEEISRSGKKMLVIAFDITEGEHKGFYKKRYDELLKQASPDNLAKWPANGIYRQMTEGEKAKGYLKGLMTALEASNVKFEWKWDEKKLKGLKFGGIFGKEEYEKMDGTRAFATKCKFIRTVEKVKEGNFKIPEDKLLPTKGDCFEGFLNNNSTNESGDDDLPF